MSFSMKFSCNRDEIDAKLAEHGKYTPESVNQFVKAAVANLKTDPVDVYAYGHLHDGTEGNYIVSTATINVAPTPVTADAIPKTP